MVLLPLWGSTVRGVHWYITRKKKRERSWIIHYDHCLSWLQLLMVGLKSPFFLLKHTGCNKHAQPVGTRLFLDVLEWGEHNLISEQFHVATYPKFILSVNFSSLMDKLFYCIQISFFSCLKQGSFLLILKCSCKWVIPTDLYAQSVHQTLLRGLEWYYRVCWTTVVPVTTYQGSFTQKEEITLGMRLKDGRI